MSHPAAVYRPRNPPLSDYYRCVEDYFETFVKIYDEHFSRYLCMTGTGRTAASYIADDVFSQLPINDDHLYRDPEYSWDEYLRA